MKSARHGVAIRSVAQGRALGVPVMALPGILLRIIAGIVRVRGARADERKPN
jgi:hypothetical protein